MLSILPPDIHLSGEGFKVEEDGAAIRVGLIYSKGLSHKALDSILAERRRKPFTSVKNLYGRTAVARDALENLVKGGFLDPLSPTCDASGRGALLSEVAVLPKKPFGRRKSGQDELPLSIRRGQRTGGSLTRCGVPASCPSPPSSARGWSGRL